MNASAKDVATYDNIFDFELIDCISDYRRGVFVVGMEDVGNVAVHEDVAGTRAGDCCFGDARVGAADEENARVLACRILTEQVWVGRRQ